jgi:arylsulfatase A-like enzyme
VLFVFSDQQRGMDVGYTGDSPVDTPAVDELAEEGRRYPNACATVPVCGPNRACLLTGQYPQTNGVIANDLPLATDAPSVAERFREAGYRTGYVGKWHLDGVPRDKFTPPGPRRQGFDDCWAVYNCAHDYMEAQYYRDDPEPIDVDGYEPVTQTDLALEFLERDDDRPFCLFVSYGPPHNPYREVPEEYLQRYDPEELPLRPNVELSPPPSRARSTGRGDAPETERALREQLAGYYAHVEALDDQVGRLLDALDAEGVADDTVVTYTSDHGDMLGSQGASLKQWPWAESVSVPFVIRWPGEIPAGTRDAAPLATVDVAPTLCGIADVDPDERMEGTDRSDGLRGADADEEAPDAALIGIQFPHVSGVPEWRGLRTPRYTYARSRNGEPWVLYDDEADPHQRRNLALDADHRDIRERLDHRLDRFLEGTDDPFLEAYDQLRHVGRVEAWNERERVCSPDDPDLVDVDR